MIDTLDRRQDAFAAGWDSVREEVLDDVDHAQRVSATRFMDVIDFAITEARAQLDRALARLDSGLYGICESCRGRIGTARLDFRPESTRCLGCQTASELGLRSDFKLIDSRRPKHRPLARAG